jgi:hypothetical protein
MRPSTRRVSGQHGCAAPEYAPTGAMRDSVPDPRKVPSVLRQVVSSQIIHTVGYDAMSSRLEVQFQNGWIYEYDDVPQSVHIALMTAPSHGRYLKRHIVDQFVTRRIS